MVRGRSNFYSGARQMFRESRMCSQTIHYATKGEITGMIAACNSNFINPGPAVFAREGCVAWKPKVHDDIMLNGVFRICLWLVARQLQIPNR